jgi:hypothetical protein
MTIREYRARASRTVTAVTELVAFNFQKQSAFKRTKPSEACAGIMALLHKLPDCFVLARTTPQGSYLSSQRVLKRDRLFSIMHGDGGVGVVADQIRIGDLAKQFLALDDVQSHPFAG